MYVTYILKSLKSNKHYIGHTNNLKRRLLEHNMGKSVFAKLHRPFKIIYSKEYKTKTKAYQQELKIKSYKGGEAFKKIISRAPRPGGEVAGSTPVSRS